MARGIVPVGVIGRPGPSQGLNIATVVPVAGDATNGHTVANDGRTFIEAKNTNASATSRDFKVTQAQGVDGGAHAIVTTAIAAGVTVFFGPYPPSLYGGSLLVDVSHAEVTLRAFRLPAS
jgi:hypothetical protein